MEKEYVNLHKELVIKYFWQVMRGFKLPFFVTIFGSVIAAGLDIYIPLRLLKLWDVLSTNDFSFVYEAKNIVISIYY